MMADLVLTILGAVVMLIAGDVPARRWWLWIPLAGAGTMLIRAGVWAGM